MKLTALIGSLRAASYNRMIFNHYKFMVGAEAELTEGIHRDFPPYDDDVMAKTIPPKVTDLGNQLRAADGVLFFSPEYNYSLPGYLKNSLDWLSRLKEQPLAGKPVAIISASPGKLGGARMQYHFRQIAVGFDMHVLNRPEVMISEVHKKVDAQGQLVDEDTKKFLKTHFESFKKFVNR